MTSLNKIKWILLVTSSIWIAGLLTVLYIAYDGYIFPVTSQVEITSIQEYDEQGGWSTVAGRFTKFRGECRFAGIEWWFGNLDLSRNSSVLVESYFDDGPIIRATEGVEEFTLLRVRIRPELIRDGSYAYVLHRCPGQFWVTRTLFYQPSS